MPAGGHLATGHSGEEAALAVYLGRGYRLVARNWRCPLGEIDLILRMGNATVFCEVKARRGTAFGGPHDAVTWRKQRKLRSLAEAFLATSGSGSGDGSGNGDGDVRFDVASVVIGKAGPPVVEIFEQAF